MKTHDQTHPELSHLADKLKGHRVAMLTLFEPGHGLSSRPMTPLEMDPQGAIWFMASHKTMDRSLSPVGASEPVTLAFMDHGDSDYVSVVGHMQFVDDAQRKSELWTAAGRPWFDGPDDPNLVLLKITPARAEIWDGPDNVVTRTLAMAASVVAGREVGMGHKEVVEAPLR